MAVELTADQILERKAKDAERKREERKKAREDKQRVTAEKKAGEATSFPEYWEQQRTKLTQAQRDEYEARQEKIFDMLYWMQQVMDGTYNVSPTDAEYFVGIEEGDDDIKRMVREYGEAFATAVLLLPYWQEPHTLAQLTKGGENHPTTIFAKYGILTALPDGAVYKWEQFMQAHHRSQQPAEEQGNGYTIMQCGCNTLITGQESISNDIAALYKERGIKFLCGVCRALETNSRAISRAEIGKETLYQRPGNHALLDSFGRLRDQ
jgi:hypothetical protein